MRRDKPGDKAGSRALVYEPVPISSPRISSKFVRACDEPHAKNQNATRLCTCLRARPMPPLPPHVVFICLGGRFHNNLSAHPSPSTPHGSDYGPGMQPVSLLTLKHPCVPAALRPSAPLHPSHSALPQIPPSALWSSVYSVKSSNHFYPHKQPWLSGMPSLMALTVCRRIGLDKSPCITGDIWCFSDTLNSNGDFPGDCAY